MVRWLGARYAPWVVLAIGIALAAPAITANFTADDHLHRVVERDDTGIAGLHPRSLDLFTFANGNVADTEQLRDGGLFPWWVDPHLKLSFMRPLSSVTHVLDHALWPDNAAAQLAHNLVWLALSLVFAWLFFRRFLAARWIAVLALALYAFDDARGPVVGWIANRNALVALCLAMPVLLAHDRWRREGWQPGRWLAPSLFVVALGAGESSVAILAYVAAHALWLDRGSWRDRALALAPYVFLVVAWRVIYAKLGYGVFGSGIYLDPGSDPLAFLGAAAQRLPFLLAGALALPWSDFASFYPVLGVLAVMLAIALVLLGLIAFACARLLRRDPTARFFATGMLLAAIPVASTFPADRLLTFVCLGGMGLIAQLLATAVRDRAQLGDSKLRRFGATAVAVLMLVLHLVLAPPFLVLRARSMVAVARVLDRADASIPGNAHTVLIVTTPSDALVGFVPLMRHSRGQPCPDHLYWLSTATTPVTLERLDDKTLRVSPERGFLLHEVDQMMRSARIRPFAVGDRIPLSGLTMEIESVTPDGRPLTALAHFATSLDDPSLTWLRWEGHAYVAYRPPAVGAREPLPAVDFSKLLGD
ncbi:MAG TPA: hypothetical protein VFV99_16230 [Kofleriaceae bacterium]|nr:hypothetical protein [Kofleriaceae bacterium]